MARRQRSQGETPKRRRIGTQSVFCTCLPSVLTRLRSRRNQYLRQGKSPKYVERMIRATTVMMKSVCRGRQ